MQNVLRHPQIWHGEGRLGAGPSGPGPRGLPIRLVVAGVAGSFIVLGLVLALSIARPHEQDYRDQVGQVQALVEQGKTDVAVTLADFYLGQSHVSKASRTALATWRYSAAMEEIYRHQDSGNEAVLSWREAEARADQDDVPTERRLAMKCFADAKNAAVWSLARACFLKAWTGGKVGPADYRNIAGYYAVMYNGGTALLAAGDAEQGWKWAATACAIDETYSFRQGVACKAVHDRFGEEPPTPLLDDPILGKSRS